MFRIKGGMDTRQTNARFMEWKSLRMWQLLKKLPQSLGVGLCWCFTQPSCISQWLLPFSSAACVTDGCKTDAWFAATKHVPHYFWRNLWYQCERSKLCMCFLPALISYLHRRLSESRKQRTCSACTVWRCMVTAHSGRANRTACSLGHP